MKKNIIIASILGGIALVCAALIACVNMFTSDMIAKNNAKTELETCQAIFSEYDADKSEEKEVSGDTIIKKVLAKDASGNELGYLYTVTGKNSYGVITLMVAIKDNTVYQVEFLENGQSFASTVVSHVKEKYPSSKEETIVISPYGKEEEKEIVGTLDSETLSNINTSCGATFGAETVKELVTIALNDAKEAE